MANQKLSELANLAAPERDDLLYVVHELAGVLTSYQADLQDVIAGPAVFIAASDATADEIKQADYVCDGANDEVQIQAAIDALPTAGGKIRLSSGTFVLSSVDFYNNGHGNQHWHSLIIFDDDPPIQIAGSGGTTIQLADNQHDTTTLLHITGRDVDNPRTNPTVIRDITWDMNGTNQPAPWVGENIGAIEVNFSGSVLIDRCRFINPVVVGVRFELVVNLSIVSNCYFSGDAALIFNSYNLIASNNVFDCTIGSTTLSCLRVTADSDEAYPAGGTYMNYGCIVANNIFRGGYYQVQITGGYGTIVTGNVFSWKSDTFSCIRIMPQIASGNGGIYNTVIGNTFYNVKDAILLTNGAQHNVISNNVMFDGQDYALTDGITETVAGTGNNLIVDNQIQATTPITRLAGNGTIVRRNIGYVTENHGAAAGTADGGNIAHGCAATPTVVLATGSVASEFVSVTAIGAANFTVAIKDDTGAPGANQTVYWRAWV